MQLTIGPRIILFLTVCVAAVSTDALRADEKSTGLPEGWKSIVTLPEARFQNTVISRKARLRLWNEKGWLMVRRETAEGEFDWQVVLARATSAEEPKTSVSPQIGVFSLTYRDFFIREGILGNLRIFREAKKADDPEWPLFEHEVDPKGSAGTASGGPEGAPRATLASWELDGWSWLKAGALRDRPDLWVRFQPKTMTFQQERGARAMGIMLMSSVGGPAVARYGSATAFEEGDLFIVERARREVVDMGLNQKALERELGAIAPPALAPAGWINAPEPLVLENLDKQVILLSFWSEWSPASIRNLTRLQKLNEAFKGRGVVVIGVYVGSDAEKAASIVKDNEVSFAVMRDSVPMAKVNPIVGNPGGRQVVAASAGETARKYLVDILPTHFLIDKSGKFSQGYGMAPPTDEQIEALLK